MVYGLKYIGPFLRLNLINIDSIENQLYYLAKESLMHIVLRSKCGIVIPTKELRYKDIPNIDINIINTFSPLLCVYKKANPKLITENNSVHWNEESFKKEIPISGNALMILAMLELADYYKKFKEIEKGKNSVGVTYLLLAKKQLEYWAANLRNEEGLFVDKKEYSGSNYNDIKFKEKDGKFKYSDQALLMAAYYKYSCLDEDKISEEYKKFSFDIFDMFIQYRDDVYKVSFEEKNKFCLALNIFLNSCHDIKVKALLIDIAELLLEQFKDYSSCSKNENYPEQCSMLFINLILTYLSTGIEKFRDAAEKCYEDMMKNYNAELFIFLKDDTDKEIVISSSEIILSLLCMFLHFKIYQDEDDKDKIVSLYRKEILGSGILLSWPEAPDIDSMERYTNFSMKSEDLKDECNYKPSSMPCPESAEAAPIFIKYVSYDMHKDNFTQGKSTFDSSKNLFLFFMILFIKNILDNLT